MKRKATPFPEKKQYESWSSGDENQEDNPDKKVQFNTKEKE